MTMTLRPLLQKVMGAMIKVWFEDERDAVGVLIENWIVDGNAPDFVVAMRCTRCRARFEANHIVRMGTVTCPHGEWSDPIFRAVQDELEREEWARRKEAFSLREALLHALDDDE